MKSVWKFFIFSMKGKLVVCWHQLALKYISKEAQLKPFCIGICFLTLADWPGASITALFSFPLEFLSTVLVPSGRGKPFPVASQGVRASPLSRCWRQPLQGLARCIPDAPTHPWAAASLAGLNCKPFGEEGGIGRGGVEGWGENADNGNWITIKIKKKKEQVCIDAWEKKINPFIFKINKL